MVCRAMVEAHSFFVLAGCTAGTEEHKRAGTYYYDVPDDAAVGPAPTCACCGEYIGSLTWLPPYEVELECQGSEYGDVVFGPSNREFLVSGKFQSAFDRSGLRGLIGFDPVRVCRATRHGRIKGEIPQYYHVEVETTRAAVDQRQSGEVWEVAPTCDECRLNGRNFKRAERIVIEEGSWSGEDIFRPRGGGPYVVTARFRDVCQSHDITNVTFVAIERYWTDQCPWEGFDRAKPILAQPVGDPILERVVASGDLLRWDRRSNVFVFSDPEDRRIKGVFEPRDPEEFWRRY